MKKISLLVLCALLTALLAVAAYAYDDIQLPGTNTPPVIDAKLDDCYVKIHDFYSPNEDEWYDNADFGHDAKGEAWGTWDADNFYAFFKIAEEDYFPQNGEADPPGSNYSSMYLSLLATLPVNDLPENDLYVMQCSFNRSIEDTKEWKYTGSVVEQYRDNSGAYAIYDTCPFDFEVMNDGTWTYYEVKMPWDQIDRTGQVSFTEGHQWFFNYIITWMNDSSYNTVQYGQGLMNDIYDMGGIVTLVAAPGGSAAPAASGGRATVEKGADGSLQIPKTAAPLVMDGQIDDGYAKLSDFYGMDGFRTDYDPDKSISGTAYTAWDDNNFYMLLDVLTPEYEPIFDVQAIDMGIGPAGYVALLGTADGTWTDDQRFEIGIALADEDIQVWKVCSPADIKDSSADNLWFDECPYKYAVRRDAETNHIYYEFGIPWSFLDRTEMLTYKEGSQFILNYAANVHTTTDYSNGNSHLVEFGGGIWAGSYTDGAVVTLVGGSGASAPAAETPAAAEPASEAAELLAKSWDTIFVDYEMMVDGNAGGWLAENPVEGPIEQVELRGWAHVSTPIKGFAYTIDGGEAVRSEDFIQDRPDVKSIIHEEAEGFDISIEVDKLAVGDHVIKIYAIDANDNLVDTTFEFPFVKEAPPSKGLATVEDAAKGKNIIKNYEFVSGTNGFGNEGPENLWDGNTGTKFCTNEFPAESIAKLDGVYKITGFTMATANDNAEYNGRSPNAWTISVSPDGENWTELKKGNDSFFEELNFTYFAGDGKADNVGYVKFTADGTASGTFQVSELTLFGDKTADTPAAAEPEPEPEPEPETPAADEPAADTPAAETPAAEKPAETKKSGCGSMIGGGLIVLVTVLGSAWISKRR
ncbi:MAG: discoidin domain-containing protein [Clostridia bacterium]|nr:discoidin domain-containing protein [Clostridia bacterium]